MKKEMFLDIVQLEMNNYALKSENPDQAKKVLELFCNEFFFPFLGEYIQESFKESRKRIEYGNIWHYAHFELEENRVHVILLNTDETKFIGFDLPGLAIREMYGKLNGSKKSPAKARSSRLNGLKGGRPKGSKNKPKTPAKTPLKGEEKQSKQENPKPYILAGGGKRKKLKSGGVQNET